MRVSHQASQRTRPSLNGKMVRELGFNLVAELKQTEWLLSIPIHTCPAAGAAGGLGLPHPQHSCPLQHCLRGGEMNQFLGALLLAQEPAPGQACVIDTRSINASASTSLLPAGNGLCPFTSLLLPSPFTGAGV